MAFRVPPPSPEEIAARALEIRRGWSIRETERRYVYKTKVVYIPVADECLTARAICQTEFRPARKLMRLD
jgi:hypothetical protein